MAAQGQRILHQMYAEFVARPELLPERYQARLTRAPATVGGEVVPSMVPPEPAVQRVVAAYVGQSAPPRGAGAENSAPQASAGAATNAPHDRQLEVLINDTLYHEQRRLEREKKSDPAVRADKAFYRQVRKALGHSSSRELHGLFARMAQRFADEIAGHFDERVYRVATTLVPAGLSVLLRAASPISTPCSSSRCSA